MQIYLDHNATTPILDEVVDWMGICARQGYANAASQHGPGRRARGIVEDAREAIAVMLGANLGGRKPDRLIFTSGGTESNNLAIFGLAGQVPGRLITSRIEHPSVLGPVERLVSQGWRAERLGVDGHGVVQVEELRNLLEQPIEAVHSARSARGSAVGPRDQQEQNPRAEPGAKGGEWIDFNTPTVVSVMLGNNETGVLQPVAEVAALCNRHGVPLHTDAVQVVGKLPVDFQRLGVASVSFSAHKFHGPRGIGGLLVRGDVELQPLLYGGFQQAGLRPGTEPVALVAGMHKALEIWRSESDERRRRMTALRDRFEAALQSRLPEVVVNGSGAERLPHTSNVSFPGLDRRALAMALDLEGVACSTGSACASGSSEPSPVLIAMGLPTDIVAGSLRFSLGATTTEAEIDLAVERIALVCKRLRTSKGSLSTTVA